MKAVAFLVIVLFAGLYFTRQYVGKRLASAGDTSCLTVLGSTTTRADNGAEAIRGTLRNDCSCKYGYVQVTFKVTKSEQSFGDTFVNASRRDLSPGETWEFKTDAAKIENGYQFDRITAF